MAIKAKGLSGSELNLISKGEFSLDRLNEMLDDAIRGGSQFAEILSGFSGLFDKTTTKAADILSTPDIEELFVEGERAGLDDADLAKDFGLDFRHFRKFKGNRVGANAAFQRATEAVNEAKRLREQNRVGISRGGVDSPELEEQAKQQDKIAEHQNQIHARLLAKNQELLRSQAKDVDTFTPNQEAIARLKARVEEQQVFEREATERARIIERKNDEIANRELDRLLSPETQELEQQNIDIATEANERILKAQRGELDLETEAPGFTQRTENLFKQAKERGDIIGNDIDTATATSSSGALFLSNFRKEKDSLTSQIKHGILSGTSALSQGFQGLKSTLGTAASNVGLAFKGAFGGSARNVPGLNTALGFLGQSQFQGNQFFPQFGNLATGFQNLSSPFGQVRQNQFQASIANAQIASQRKSDLIGLGGAALGASAGLFLGSSRKLKKNIKPLSKRAENRVLQLVKKGNIYTWDYKWEADGKTPKHVGIIAEEAPHPIATPDRKAQDLGNTVNLLLTSVRALDRKIDRKFALTRKVA